MQQHTTSAITVQPRIVIPVKSAIAIPIHLDRVVVVVHRLGWCAAWKMLVDEQRARCIADIGISAICVDAICVPGLYQLVAGLSQSIRVRAAGGILGIAT